MTFKNKKIISLPVKDFAKKIICDCHLFLPIGEKKYYVMKPGFFVDPEFIKKHAPTNVVFECEYVVSDDIKKKFKTLFHELKYLQFEKDLREKCIEITKYFNKVYSSDEHFLTFALACYEEFALLPLSQQTKMHETDMHLYRKAFYAATFSVIVGITNDFFHYPMLRDFYNLTFSLDLGLCESNYSYYVAEACNVENKFPGSGREYLEKEKASVSEKSVFTTHPEKSYGILKSLSILSYPELLEGVLYQHELSDGKGFPRGIQKGQVSNWEAVIIFSDSLVEIIPEFQFEKSVLQYLKNFQNQKLKDIPVNRVYRKLCFTLEHFDTLKETCP
jgi:hypothetical protein